ncbi:MAG: ferritin-like domain-containing protein [Acidimicrobiia bacterium]
MTTEAKPQLPDSDEVDATIKRVENHADTIYAWNYARDREQLVTLYNKGVSSQWSSITDLDWATDVDPEELVRQQESPTDSLVRTAAELPGSPLAKWGEAEFTALGIEMFKASLSQFMHGEQGAMLTVAKLVEAVPWIDAKYYAATQTMDEARHTEVFAKYLDTKLGEAYPMSPFLEQQIDALLQDSRWDIAYLGMQIVIESLALAAFGDMLRRIQEPLLRKLLRYVMSDEARHVAFGVLSLQELYQGLTEAELKDRQEFLVENTLRSRARSTTPEVWERMGVAVDEVRPFLLEAAAKMNRGAYMGFQSAFFAKLVPNVRKLGLLDANDGYLRKAWGEAGLMEFEFADDTGTDYTKYDEVAADRAARA